MNEKKDPIQEINEFLETLMAISPTYSRVSQFVLMSLGKDYNAIKEMYPDFLGERRTRERVLGALGMSVDSNGKITTEDYALSYSLNSIIGYIFDLFERPEVRDRMTAALLNEKISNLREDWVWSRLKTIEEMSKVEGSPAAVSVLLLKILKKLRDGGGYEYNYVEIDRISENVGETVDKSVLAEAIDILMKFRLLEQSGEKYGLSDELWKYKLLIDDIGGE